jgi:hypothetical protein
MNIKKMPIWDLLCIIFFFISIIMNRVDLAALAVILFLVGIILKFFLLKDEKKK